MKKTKCPMGLEVVTKRAVIVLVAFAGMVCSDMSANAATVVYSDAFNAVTVGNLNGKTVETSSGTLGGTLGATWSSAGSFFNYSGSGVLNATSDFASTYYAFLPFTPQSGLVYTLSVDVNPDDANSANSLGVGFSSNNTLATTSQGGHSPWVRYGRDGTGKVTDGATVLGTFGADTDSSDPIRVTLTLDTTAPAYKVTWSIFNLTTTSSLATGTYTYTTNPSVLYVFLNTGNATGTFDNFELSAVPEPSLSGLLIFGTGILGLLRLRVGFARRKAAKQ